MLLEVAQEQIAISSVRKALISFVRVGARVNALIYQIMLVSDLCVLSSALTLKIWSKISAQMAHCTIFCLKVSVNTSTQHWPCRDNVLYGNFTMLVSAVSAGSCFQRWLSVIFVVVYPIMFLHTISPLNVR